MSDKEKVRPCSSREGFDAHVRCIERQVESLNKALEDAYRRGVNVEIKQIGTYPVVLRARVHLSWSATVCDR